MEKSSIFRHRISIEMGMRGECPAKPNEGQDVERGSCACRIRDGKTKIAP